MHQAEGEELKSTIKGKEILKSTQNLVYGKTIGEATPEELNRLDQDAYSRNLKVVLISSFSFKPTRATNKSSCFDLYSPSKHTILPHSRLLIPTGLILEPPIGYSVRIHDRSGAAVKYGVVILNSGIIDNDYRGEVKCLLYNTGDTLYEIIRGDRIAQLEVVKDFEGDIEVVDKLSETERGSGGFGSTGV